MKTYRYNEVLDFLEMNEILFAETKHNSILIQHPTLGACTYWSKRDKLHIHQGNNWIPNGYYYIKNNLKDL